MEMRHRVILPAPPDGPRQDDTPKQPNKQPHNTKNVNTIVACNGCRKRKTRCPGERPACGMCLRRGIICEYDAAPGESRTASVKAKNERLENELGSVLEVYWYMQNQPTADASRALEILRSGVPASRLLETLNVDSSRLPSLAEASSVHSGRGPARNNPEEFQTRDGEFVSASSDMDNFLDALRKPIASLALKSGVEAFYLCLGCTFHIFDREEGESLLVQVIPAIEGASGEWTKLIFGDALPRQVKASLCAACVMAALGLQYTRDPIPALNFKTSRENGTYSYAYIFYWISKQLLEDAIEIDDLESMKVCAAISIFNIIAHSTVALAYIDMGLGFARNHGLDNWYRPVNITESKWIGYRKVIRTLVTLRSWLAATLGFIPSKDFWFGSPHQWATSESNVVSREVLQEQMAKVTLIKANMLRILENFNIISPSTIRSIFEDLKQWHQDLPQWMQLGSVLGPEAPTTDLVRVVFLVHLFYLSAFILVARICHGGRRRSEDLLYNNEERVVIKESVVAARTAAHILRLQLRDGAVFQRCWLAEFTAYTSCLTLLYSTARMILYRRPQHIWQRELLYAKMCLDLLLFCGNVDTVAQQFSETTQEFYNILASQGEAFLDENVTSQWDSTDADFDTLGTFDHLFTTPPAESPTEQLYSAFRRLFDLLSWPFGYPPDAQAHGTFNADEVDIGSHLDWANIAVSPFNRVGSDPTRKPPTVSFERATLGQFIESPTPHGWTAATLPPS